MLITIDKEGSINLPVAIRKDLGLEPGSYFDISVIEGGNIMLNPVSIYHNVRLNEKGLEKLREARESGTGTLPDWLIEDMKNRILDHDDLYKYPR
ncbi:SpoVT-AbrB domain-containing protein [Candidatus Magnetomoraceae bacterium gMMP-15]